MLYFLLLTNLTLPEQTENVRECIASRQKGSYQAGTGNLHHMTLNAKPECVVNP
jgi:hypothetical protein